MLFANVVMGIVAESINKYRCSLTVDAKPELVFKSARAQLARRFQTAATSRVRILSSTNERECARCAVMLGCG